MSMLQALPQRREVRRHSDGSGAFSFFDEAARHALTSWDTP